MAKRKEFMSLKLGLCRLLNSHTIMVLLTSGRGLRLQQYHITWQCCCSRHIGNGSSRSRIHCQQSLDTAVVCTTGTKKPVDMLRLSAVDQKTYPMYLIFHGIDHLYHTAVPADGPVIVGTTLTWCEIPLTGCTYNQSSATAPWICPAQRTGFVRSDSSSNWSDKFHTRVNMTVTRFDLGGIEFIAEQTDPFFGGNNKRTVVTTRHTWQDSKQGLLLKTQQWLGLMQAGSTMAYDTSLIAPIANAVIKQRYLDSATNISNANVTAAGYMAILHYLQEYGSLPFWLPQLWKAHGGKQLL
eukprot:GHRR01027750.1.p1 GENE.GHRR01027750.1~~GHRR01027750.1.p1  ORF type:complete len:297 (+),score=78.50 GHRR01027750.1:478-1368(+)